jgi:hypothetical protein
MQSEANRSTPNKPDHEPSDAGRLLLSAILLACLSDETERGKGHLTCYRPDISFETHARPITLILASADKCDSKPPQR